MTSLLDAVNHVLRAIRESPIASLESSPLPEEASEALDAINRISRETQNHGWWFNTTPKMDLAPNSEGEITLPSTVLRVSSLRYLGDESSAIQRGSRLYNAKLDTYTFDKPVTAARVVKELPWDETPEVFRVYVMKRAAREISARMLGAQITTQSTAFDEQDAFDQLIAEELRVLKPNMRDNRDLLALDIRYPT